MWGGNAATARKGWYNSYASMKKACSKNEVTAESIARMADKGKNVSRFFTNAGRIVRVRPTSQKQDVGRPGL
jgi:hypothetical protein